MKSPTVSVIMPAYNASQFLGEAVESILAQTFSDFEFIIINDGSTDNSKEILASYEERDSRIQVINQENSGIGAALNIGLERARGRYIARMDADDIALPNRFEEQVRFMDDNPQIGVAGTHAVVFGEQHEQEGLWVSDTDNRRMQARVCFGPTFCHPTVFIRREVLLQFGIKYSPAYSPAEDFKLWQELAQVTQFANLPQPLLRYRNHNKQASISKSNDEKDAQMHLLHKTLYDQLTRLGIIPTERERWVNERLRRYESVPDFAFLQEAEQWILKIHEANNRLNLFPNPEFNFYLGKDWHSTCFRSTEFGPKSYFTYRKSPLYKIVEPSYHKENYLRFFAKAMLWR